MKSTVYTLWLVALLPDGCRTVAEQHRRAHETHRTLSRFSGTIEAVAAACGSYPASSDQPLGVDCHSPSAMVRALLAEKSTPTPATICDAWGHLIEFPDVVLLGAKLLPGTEVSESCRRRFGDRWSDHALFYSRGADGSRDIAPPRISAAGELIWSVPKFHCQPYGSGASTYTFKGTEARCDLVHFDGEIVSYGACSDVHGD